ncbi:MAG: signal peptidase II [bacterium]
MKAWLAFVLTVLADQSSKALVQRALQLKESVQLVGSLVKITYIHNPKGAFGLPLGGRLFFVIFSVLASLFILYYLFRIPKERVWSKRALALILGGAVGNLIDRFRFGEVVDFIDLGVGNTRWPIFNVADIAVTAGVALLLYTLLLKKES